MAEPTIEQLQAQIQELSEKKQGDSRSVWFCCVCKQSEHNQMEVARWIMAHPETYSAVSILHDRDKKIPNAEEEEERGEGGLVDPHLHILFRIARKCSARSLTKRFCGYVHFQATHDADAYYAYMLHRNFKCSFLEHKHKYELSDFETNNLDFLAGFQSGVLVDTQNIMSRWRTYMHNSGNDVAAALSLAFDCNDWALISEVSKKPYFYSKFFGG